MQAIELTSIGRRVAHAREARGLKQAELARRIGFSQPSVSDLENDRTKEVSAKLLDAVAQELRVPWEYLLHGKDMQSSSEEAASQAELVGLYRSLKASDKVSLLEFARHLGAKQKPQSGKPDAAPQPMTDEQESGSISPPVDPSSAARGGLFDVQVGGSNSDSAAGKPRAVQKQRRRRDT